MSDKYLVIGASGAQGGAVARRLAGAGHRVRGLTRAGAGPAGIEWVAGDLADPAAVRAGFDGVTHASVILPLIFDRDLAARYVHNIIEAATGGTLRRLVFNTSTRLPAVPSTAAVFEIRRAAAEAFLRSEVPTVVLRPPTYLDNLGGPWVLPALVGEGVLGYPIAPEPRVAWLPLDDLAAITVAAFGKDELIGTAVDVCGAENVTGPELAQSFAAALDRPVTYAPMPVAEFEAGLGQVLGPEVAREVAATYHLIGTPEGAGLYEGDPTKVAETFGVRLTPVREWVAAQSWTVSPPD